MVDLLLLLMAICCVLINMPACDSACDGVRLVNGNSITSGRLEVCYNGQWRTVCADNLYYNDARVVCNQLGYENSYSLVYYDGTFGSVFDRSSVLQTDSFPYCNGNENDLLSCKMFMPVEDTTHCVYDFGMSCIPQSEGNYCVEGSTELTESNESNEGNVEICYNGYWGAVCEKAFGIFDGRVVCRQLGYKDDMVEIYRGIKTTLDFFWFSRVHCTGMEESLVDCDRRFDDELRCLGSHVAVRCFNETVESACEDGSIRLVNGSSETEGVLEVCYLGAWGRVCQSDFGKQDASVACKQMGFSSNGTDTVLSDSSGSTVLLSSVDCIGNETSLFQCTSTLGNSACDTNQTVRIECANVIGECETGSIRLAAGSPTNSGRLEVCFLNQWGTVCEDQFDQQAALVACRQLGFTLNDADYTANDVSILVYDPVLEAKKIWLSDLFCFGGESSLFGCPRLNQIGNNLCVHSEDIFVTCYDVIEFLENDGPARTVLGSQRDDAITTNVTLSCDTVQLPYNTNLQWSWSFNGNVLPTDSPRYKIQSNNTSSSLLIRNLRYSDSGNYSCSAYHPDKYNTSLRTRQQNLDLTVNISHVPNTDVYFTEKQGATVTLTCEVSGYLANGIIHWWISSGPKITSIPGKYNIVPNYGTVFNSIDHVGNLTRSMISTLTISSLRKEDAGTYECTYLGKFKTINIIYTNSSTVISTTTSVNTITSSQKLSPSPSMVPGGSPNQSNDSTPAIIGGVIAVAIIIFVLVLTLVVLVMVYCVRRKGGLLGNKKSVGAADLSDNKTNEYIGDDNRVDRTGTTTLVELKNFDSNGPGTGIKRQRNALSETLLKCSIPPSDLKLLEKIGQGEFGIVYRGILTDHEKNGSPVPVAIKTLRGCFSNSQIDELIEEAEKMQAFNDLHVLTLTGVCVDLLESPCIVMPFMSNGSLLSYLRREALNLTVPEIIDESIRRDTSRELLSMCLQVAKGMAYLAKQKFVHRDLAARNCMISAEGLIKVADFGLTEDIYTAEYFKQSKNSEESVKLPLKWMALESIHYGKFSEKSDVWSYGILCWEVFSCGKTPYPGMSPKQVVSMLDSGERLDKPSNAACQEEIYSLMLSCWNASSSDRPSFQDLVEKVNTLLMPLANYMDLRLESLTISMTTKSTELESLNIYY